MDIGAVLEGQKKEEKRKKKQFNLFQRLILLPSELIKLLEYMQSHLF